ncbi:MAG: hypothetical protein AAF152_03180 [Cyanobacteria bacterium P01_A01_bin.114]
MSILSRLNQLAVVKFGSMALAAVVFLPACAQDATTPREEANVDVEEVAEETNELIGESVSIRGVAEEMIDDASFLLQEEGLFEGDDVLVINVSEQPLVLPEGEGQQVQVTGEVAQLVIADIETTYDLTLDPELYADYEEKAVILAQSLALAPDPEDIAENPEQYYNQVIAVEGTVDDVYAEDVFSIDGDEIIGEDDLLVVSQFGVPSLSEDGGEDIVVTGTLRPFVAAEVERDYDLNWDLSVQEQIEAEFSEKPVFFAESVYTSAL